MVIKLTLTAQSEETLRQAVTAAQTHFDAVTDLYRATLYFRADEDCTPFDLAGALREVPGVRVEIEAELER